MNKKNRNEISSTVTMHCNFYRDQYRRLVFVTGLVLLVNLACSLVIVFLMLDKPADVYIPAEQVYRPDKIPNASDLAITPRIPLNRPNMEKMELTQWVLDAIGNSFTYNLQRYKQQKSDNEHYYTDSGWEQYMQILNRIVQFDTLTTQEALVSLIQPQGSPIIYNQGLVNSVYTWVYDFPIMVLFKGTVNIPTETMTLHITVSRTSMEEDVDGVKITGIKAVDVRSSTAIPIINQPFSG